MAAKTSTDELLKKLDEQHQAYLETFRLVHEALSQNFAANNAPSPTSPASLLASNAVSPPTKRRRRSTLDIEAERPHKASVFPSSIITGESISSDEEDDELYVQTPLPKYSYDHESLRHHLKTYKFKEEGLILLDTVIKNGRLLNPSLFPESSQDDRSHYSILDVSGDGSPLSRREVVSPGTMSIDSAIWQAIQDLNSSPTTQRIAVGRITIVREPSPIIFGALHLTMNKDFDMDEIFYYLVSEDVTTVSPLLPQVVCSSNLTIPLAHLTDRAFCDDVRRQRSFVFNFDYYTVVGEDLQPMPWQLTDSTSKSSPDHIPISRCNSVVALSLSGGCVKKLRNASRRSKAQHGYVYDPWAPWHVLNIQCYPDHKHSMDSHDSTKHYVNGPDAFMHTLLAEFKDAEKRFAAIYARINKLISPPPDFMFNGKLRDKLLFEDENFTYSRRYFWAYQTLGIMNNAIKAIIDNFEDTFTDDVWEGRHKSLWPMLEQESPRNVYWRKRMANLRKEFEREIRKLEELHEENNDRRKEIRSLRDQLFSGTSVLESRKSVDMAAVTVLQGHNIKLLTLVSIFFLPLTFVTSVFGMTNIPADHQFRSFGIVMATVCIPFFLLIGSLNTTSGMEFWRSKWSQFIAWAFRLNTADSDEDEKTKGTTRPQPQARSLSSSVAMATRVAQLKPVQNSNAQPSQTSARKDSASVSPASPSSGNQDPTNINVQTRSNSADSATAKKLPESLSTANVEAVNVGIVKHPTSVWQKLVGRNRRWSGRENVV